MFRTYMYATVAAMLFQSAALFCAVVDTLSWCGIPGGSCWPKSPPYVVEAFVVVPTLRPARAHAGQSRRGGSERYASPSGGSDLDELRKEIEDLRREARERIKEVSIKADNVFLTLKPPPPLSAAPPNNAPEQVFEKKNESPVNAPVRSEAIVKDDGIEFLKQEEAKMMKMARKDPPRKDPPVPLSTVKDDGLAALKEEEIEASMTMPRGGTIASLSSERSIDVQQKTAVRATEMALEGTCWKVALDIGREPGTWMPSDWGVSGRRLVLQLQVQFCRDKLYQRFAEREEFLGDGGGKVVRVLQNDGVVGPGVSESARHVRFKDGGWTISRGEGPYGTDLLRFYVELEEKVERDDLYCPAGRIYLTCGYFDITRRGRNGKRDLEKKLDDLANEYNTALDEQRGKSMFSMERLKSWGSLQEKRANVEKVEDELERIQVMEPDLDLLRLSREGDVGITKEGGACCKVKKGGGGYFEYHILGKFQAASVEPGEEVR